MTIPQFLKLLRKTPRRWRLLEGAIRLRRGVDWDCTISSLRKKPSVLFLSVARELGLSFHDTVMILCATDGGSGAGPPAEIAALRRQLLRACGVKGPK
jgi:hypothetical protein